MDMAHPQWPLVFVLAASGIGLVYYFAPDVEQDFVGLTPGSVTATNCSDRSE